MIPYSVYLVDDEPSIRKGITFALKKRYQVKAFSSGEDALPAITQKPPDLVLLDIGLPGINGIETLAEIKKIDADIIIIMITAYEDINTVVSAMKSGAHDYIIKPIQMDSLMTSVRNALDTKKLRKEIEILQERYIRENLPCFIGESNVIQDVIQFMNRVARSPDTPILVSGESGTGKELIAHSIHYKSPNFRGPFVSLNCASIPKHLIESELFGYERGAFSGAAASGKEGLIEDSAGGTLFLDGVNDLNMAAQAKLLRFLEFGEYYRLGGTQKRTVKTRIVSATNRDLLDMVEDGLFRLDLYYRLAVIKIEIPTLNERPEDILPIAKYFLSEFNKKNGSSFKGFSPQAEAYLLNHHWKGNIRELKNLVERGVLMGEGDEITLKSLGVDGERRRIQEQATHTPETGRFPTLSHEGINMADLEKHYISEAFKRAKGNDAEAAKLLRMRYYSYRYRRKKLGIELTE